MDMLHIQNGATPLGLTTDEPCREIFEHHAAILKTLASNPGALVSAAHAHCATLLSTFTNNDTKATQNSDGKATEETNSPSEARKLPLRAYQLEPSFLWAPCAARSLLFAWARDISIAINAAGTAPFVHLPDDCQGDVVGFLEPTTTREEMSDISERWSLCPEVCAWVRGVVTAAVAVKHSSPFVFTSMV